MGSLGKRQPVEVEMGADVTDASATWTIEKIMGFAHDLGRLGARQDGVEATVVRVGVEVREEMTRNSISMRGELNRLEEQMRTERAADRALVSRSIKEAIERSHVDAAAERANELKSQNALISSKLERSQQANQFLIVGFGFIVILGGKALEYGPRIYQFLLQGLGH